MNKLDDIFCWCEDVRLTEAEAGAMLGVSERTFRRYCRHHEEAEPVDMVDEHPDRASSTTVPVEELE